MLHAIPNIYGSFIVWRLSMLRHNFTAVAILAFMAIAAIVITYVAIATRGL